MWTICVCSSGPYYLKWSRGEAEFTEQSWWEGCPCRSRTTVLRPWIASHSSAWKREVGIRPLCRGADNTVPDGSALWPVTPEVMGWGESEQRPGFKDCLWSSSFFHGTRGSLIEEPPPQTPSVRCLTPKSDCCREAQGEEWNKGTKTEWRVPFCSCVAQLRYYFLQLLVIFGIYR